MLTYIVLFLKLGLPLVVSLVFRRWLMALWVICVLVFPLSQVRVAGAPLYVMDAVTALLTVQVSLLRMDPRRPKPFPWHWAFVLAGGVSTLSAGILLFGFYAEQLWIWGHYSAVYLCLYIVFRIYRSADPDYFLTPLRWGLSVGLVACAGIALIQYFSLPGQEQVRSILYGDLTARSAAADVGEVYEAAWTNLEAGYVRVPGSHLAPTAFGGVVLLGFGVLAMLEVRKFTSLTLLGGVAVAIVTATTVSRHVVLALGIGVLGLIVFGTNKQRAGLAASIAGFAALSSPYVAYIAGAWAIRMDRFESGVLGDENITARVVDGPLRLIDFFSQFPELLLFGAGLEPEKLITRAGLTDAVPSGFASNGYLLILYYLGAAGFVAYCAFWLNTLLLASKSKPAERGITMAVSLVCGVIIASDNYAVIHEPASTLLCLAAACVIGERIRQGPEVARPVRPEVSGGKLRF